MNIRAIFFDFGGVIQRTEYQAPRQQLAQRFGMEYEDIDRIVFNSPTAAQATIGEISVEKHWQAVAQRLKVGKAEIAAVEREFFAGDVVDLTILGYLRSLRPRYLTGLISNAWSDMREYLIRAKIGDAFDHLTISAEVGVAKPNARIYQLALEQAQVKAGEAVFVDDVIANIEACEQVGMKGILFKDPHASMEQLKKLLKE
ncbi:MAG: HAD family phosphatase [Chloroflexi bacterium]|nr:HAD family phosphatase [Chloroflexota bacterium]MBI3168524.1 HAD family phosphatase [Chloroflexota bacterium]